MMKSLTKPLKSTRGSKYCRACDSDEIHSVLDLGNLPIANELPNDLNSIIDLFPLEFGICKNCGLGQVGEPVTRERLFNDYRYLSSISNTWLKHACAFASSTVAMLNLSSKDLVVEIASNDGYLLQYFQDFKVRTLGVEPAFNISSVANDQGIPTINAFFGTQLAREIKMQYGAPKLIVANNVAAHVPDLADFFGGFQILADEETIISIENPSILNLLLGNQFDTIYHEHFSYLSAYAVRKISSSFNLNLFRVETLTTHGGSNRYWLKRTEISESEREQVDSFIENEINSGLLDFTVWREFEQKVRNSLSELNSWLATCKAEGRNVYGFAAAAKASTILNVGRIDASNLSGIGDSSLEKQGRYLPSSGVPIISLESLSKGKPTDILIFAWNISQEISELIWREIGDDIRCWIAIPTLKEILHA